MKQRSGSSSLFALKLKSFASLVKWCAAHYTRHMKYHVSLQDLYGLCVNARTDSGKSLAVWMNQNQTIPGWFPEHITRVFSGISVWKRLKTHPWVWPSGSFCYLQVTLSIRCGLSDLQKNPTKASSSLLLNSSRTSAVYRIWTLVQQQN